MNECEGDAFMQIVLTVSDALVREAGFRGLSVVDYVDLLIDKGRAAARERSAVSEAIDRIRVLRTKAKSKD
jgi:hypothetical protein